LSDMMVDVNKQRMIDNQTYVKHILQKNNDSSDIKLQFLQNTSTVMHRPCRFTTFTLGLARRHSCGKNAEIIFDNLFKLIIIFCSKNTV
jgi:hypothetical protein